MEHTGKRESNNPLKYTFDGHFFPTTPPDSTESENEDSQTRQNPNLSSSIQVMANSMLRMELAELAIMKKREAARLEAENRRAELEFEMTRVILQTQLQIASLVSQNSSSRKRKRFSNDNSTTSK